MDEAIVNMETGGDSPQKQKWKNESVELVHVARRERDVRVRAVLEQRARHAPLREEPLAEPVVLTVVQEDGQRPAPPAADREQPIVRAAGAVGARAGRGTASTGVALKLRAKTFLITLATRR